MERHRCIESHDEEIFACILRPLDSVIGNTVGKNMPVNRLVIRGGSLERFD